MHAWDDQGNVVVRFCTSRIHSHNCPAKVPPVFLVLIDYAQIVVPFAVVTSESFLAAGVESPSLIM